MILLIDPPRVLGERRKTFEKILKAGPCTYCPARPAGTLDHVRPRAHGGDNSVLNIVGACEPCNQDKGAEPSLLLFLLARLT